MTDEKPQWLAELEKQPCRCIACGVCHGIGTIRVGLDGLPTIDDLSDLIQCDFYSGGIVEVCDRCQELHEYDEDDF